MIALNEILKNRELYEIKYNAMGTRHNINKIIKLEQKFVVFDDNKNKNRAKCNKLCAEVAEKINQNEDTGSLLKQINSLDKQIKHDEKKAKRAMNRINKILRQLPNLPLKENTADVKIKSKQNPNFTRDNFISELEKFSDIQLTQNSNFGLLNSYKKMVLKSETLPLAFELKESHSTTFLLFGKEKFSTTFDNLVNILTQNATTLTQKSIKNLKKDSSIEYLANFNGSSEVSIEFLGEYISRDISLKYYDKSLDMTKFVNMIRITIKANH